MSRIKKVIEGSKPAFIMVMVQVSYVVLGILFKMVANDGINFSVILAYRSVVASAFVIPIAYFVERKSKPKITATVLFQAFLCGLFGASLQHNLYANAMALVEATYVTAMCNLIPGVTFILAICFRLERFNIGTATGKAKVLGSLMGIGGAMILTFYKRTKIHMWSTHVNLAPHLQPHYTSTTDPLWGSALAFGYCVSYSIWLIIQAKMSENFPWQYTSAALMSVMASIQTIIFALCTERDWNQWKLGWNIRLVTIIYTGVVTSGIVWLLVAWCVHLKGPFYASIFNPLHLVLMTIAASFILDETLYLGSIIGSLLIVFGLYTVLWGKGKELERVVPIKQTKGSLEVESLEIISTKQENYKIVKNDNNEMKSSATVQPSFLMETHNLSNQENEEIERKPNPIDHQGLKT